MAVNNSSDYTRNWWKKHCSKQGNCTMAENNNANNVNVCKQILQVHLERLNIGSIAGKEENANHARMCEKILQVQIERKNYIDLLAVENALPTRAPERKEEQQDWTHSDGIDSDRKNIYLKKSPAEVEEKCDPENEQRLSVRTDLSKFAWNGAETNKESDQSDSDYFPEEDLERKEGRTSHNKAYVPCSDDRLYCNDCSREWKGDCPIHGPLFIVENRPVPPNIKDLTRAKRTVPILLTVADSKIPDAGCGVWAREDIPARTRFGPYEGQILPPEVGGSAFSWVVRKNGEPHHCIDATEPGLSNWMRYVNCARHYDEQNLDAFQYGGKLFYRTIRPILRHQELLVWYGDDLGRHYGVDPVNQNDSSLKETTFKCSACPVACASPMLLIRHEKLCKNAREIKYQGMRKEMLCEMKTNERLRGEEKPTEEPVPAQEVVSNPVVKSEISKDQLENSYIEKINDEVSKSSAPEPAGPSVQGSFPCPICKKEFTRNWCLSVHMQIHTGEKPYVCSTCCRCFTSMSSMKNHEKTHSDHRPFVCTQCGKRFSQSTNLRLHILAKHSAKKPYAERPYACSECPKRYNSRHYLQTHLRVHNGEKPFACTYCDRQCHTLAILNSHLKTHTGEKPYACDQCDKRYSQAGSLSVHKRMHTGEKKYECSECGKRFGRIGHLYAHRISHTKVKPHVCTVCNMRFAHSGGLKTHVETHEENRPRPFACTQCDKRFHRRGGLKSHLLYHTGGINRYPCPVCKKKYSKDYLPTHMQIHTGERPYACSECSQTFHRKHVLTIHMRNHTGERPYACQECDMAFTALGSLKSHETLHDKNRSVVCELCNKQYSSASTLIGHINSFHKGLKPFVCTFGICDQQFTRKVLLEDHIRAHHTGERPFRCTDCDQLFYSKQMLRDHARRLHEQSTVQRRRSTGTSAKEE